MDRHYALDLALLQMAGLIRDAELERAAAAGRRARPTRPSRSRRLRLALKELVPASIERRSLRPQRP
jgi:hypothetical protein